MKNQLDQLIQLLSSKRRFDEDRTEPVDLMKEFLRREALWAQRLDIRDELPFANLPHAIAPKNQCPSDLTALVEKFSTFSILELQSCHYMAHWYSILKTNPSVIEAFDLPDPYVALFQIFLLGATFTREHREFIDIGYGRNWSGLQAGMIQKHSLSTPYATID